MQITPLTNGHAEAASICPKVTPTLTECVNGDENPKAFPNLPDEKLEEAGIASFKELNLEIT